MLQVLHPDVLKVDHSVIHLHLGVSSCRRLDIRHPIPLIDASIATCCNHLLRVLVTHMRVRSKGVQARTPNSQAAWGPHRLARDAGAHGETVQAQTPVQDVRELALLIALTNGSAEKHNSTSMNHL
jgi:hypothetical protein